MIKIIAFVIMVLAFVANFLVPRFLKNKSENVTESDINKFKFYLATVVVICALLIFLI